MGYQAKWFNDDELVEIDEFDDLLEARAFIMHKFDFKQEALGANAVKLCDDRATYFQIER